MDCKDHSWRVPISFFCLGRCFASRCLPRPVVLKFSWPMWSVGVQEGLREAYISIRIVDSPKAPKTQIIGFQGLNMITFMAFGTESPSIWVLGPLG